MFIKYFQCIHPDRINVRNSAAGTASQTPVIPRKYGKVTRQITRKKSVLENEIIAETFPFDNAVKIPDEMMLIPLNKKFTAKMRNPTDASSKVAESLVKTDTINPEHRTNAGKFHNDLICISKMFFLPGSVLETNYRTDADRKPHEEGIK